MFPEPSRSRTVHFKCVKPAWVKMVQSVRCLYILNKITPESMCVSTTMILTRKLKISESVTRKWEIGTYPLVIHPVAYGLLEVSPDLCNYQKLTSETGMGTPPVFCVGRTQGSSRADTGEFFSDTGEFEGKFVLMGGSLGEEANKVCFCI